MYRFKSSHTRRAGFRLAIFLVALSFLAGFFHIKGVVADATAIQPMGAEFEAKVSDSEPEYTCTDLSLYDGNTCHFVLQYCDGTSLNSLLRASPRLTQTLQLRSTT